MITAETAARRVNNPPRVEAGVRRTVLPNGLTVLSEHMPWVRSVALGTWVKSASIHEPREKMGVSHLLEHAVFKATPTRSARDIALSLEVLGGSLDAYTSREHTSYQARVLDEHATQAAEVLADVVFRPLLREADVAMERKVVLEEISMVEDTPDDQVFELHNSLLWGSHPYGYSILGTRDSVAALTAADLRDLHSATYHCGEVVVAAAGNIDHDALLDVLDRSGWLEVPPSGGSPRQPEAPRTSAPSYAHHDRRDQAQTHVVLGTATVPHRDPRRYAIALVSVLLGGGMSSRLFQRVREELGLAYTVQTFQSFHLDTGMQGVYVATAPETADDAVRAINDELASVAANGMPEEEIELGRSQLKGQVTLSMESVSSRMYRAATGELFGEPIQTLDEVLALIDAIDAGTVRKVCGEFFAPDIQTMVSLGPKPLRV
ncbi:MAG TPA: pitrilysin family protein [Gemmatimonadaceae bacterium]|nr:pitrilysin family protein [Gemmatimonadaceae bacterium]